MIRRVTLAFVALVAAIVSAAAAEPAVRPRMGQMPAATSGREPPSPRELVDARETLERRFRAALSSADTAAGANAATAALLDASVMEEDRALKWLLLAEARRLAAATGDATAIDRSIRLAEAAFDFDAVAEEHRLLREIPLRALSRPRAAGLAEVAEGLAQRAEADGRRDVAADSWALAIRGWQRAGDGAAARRAATALGRVERERPASALRYEADPISP
jgi:hypothetical protein